MSTASPATRVLGATALASLAVAAFLALVVSPDDVVQGDAVRLMYVHVPTIWVAYGAFLLTAVASFLYLRRKDRRYDRVAAAAAEIGVVFTGLCLVTGMFWGRTTWGVFWQWDARLTTTALLFALYLGYVALRRVPSDPDVRARRSAIAALIAFVDVPIVHFSVDWWRTLHQKASITPLDTSPEITGEMLQTLLFSLLAFTLAAGWALVHRVRLERLEEDADDRALARAIAERRAESGLAGAPS